MFRFEQGRGSRESLENRGLPTFTGSYGGLAPGSTDMKPAKHAN